MLVKRQVLLAKIESTYNTNPTPTASTDAIQVENLSWAFTAQRMTPQEAVSISLGKLKSLYGGALMQITFDMHVKGSGVAGTAPECGVPLRSCALGETVVASTSVTYAPVSGSHESCTLYLYEDGKLYKVTGCRGSVSGAFPAGEPGKLSFTLTGHFGGETDVSLVSPTLDSTVPPVVLSAGFTIGSYAAVISTLSWDLGNTVATPATINSGDGYADVTITGRDVSGTIDPESVLKATNDFIADWQADTAMAMSTISIGSAGNQYSQSFTEVTYTDVAPGDRDGIRTMELPFKSSRGTGEQDFSLAFT